jgi:hypothetical protein
MQGAGLGRFTARQGHRHRETGRQGLAESGLAGLELWGREADITGRHSFAVTDEIKPSAPALDQLGSGYEAARVG